MSRNILNKIRQAHADLMGSVQSAKWPDFSEVVAFTKESPVIAGGLAGAGMTLLLGSVGLLDGYYFPGGYLPHDTTALRIGSVLMSGVSGFALGWLFSDRAKVFRAFMLGGAAGIATIATVADHGALGWAAASTLSIGCFMAGFGYWFGKTSRRFFSIPTTFGSSRWATSTDLMEHHLTDDDGLLLGEFVTESGPIPLSYKGDRHLLTVSPTRSGKGSTALVPNLLTYEGSMLVIDPKGENAMMTAQRRREMGQKVYVVDPWMITASAGLEPSRFNPLDWLEDGDMDITENAMLLADALIVPSPNHEAFWDEEAKALLQGLILHIATDKSEAGNRSLARLRDLLMLDQKDMAKLFKLMEQSPHHIVASTGARSLQKDEKLLNSVISTAQSHTHFLDSARIRESLSGSDFRFEYLKTEAITIYLVLPADRLKAFSRWLRLLVQQAITVNARNIEIQPKKPIIFMLDEMGALGNLTMVEQAFSLMAGYGFQLWGVVTDLSLLKKHYGDAWQTFIANAGALQYFGSLDTSSSEEFSKMCGVTTVWNFSSAVARTFGSSRSSSAGGGSSGSSHSLSETDTTSATQRRLAYADELARMQEHEQLLLVANVPPILGHRYPWFKDDALKDLGRNLRKAA